MNYAFWDLDPVDGVVTEVGGETIDAIDVNDLHNVRPEFSIVQDDTSGFVLLVESVNPVSLKINDIVLTPTVPEWYGGIPIKPK